MTEPRALDSARRRSTNQVGTRCSWLVLVKSGGNLDAGPVMDDVGVVESPCNDPVPSLFGIDGVPLPIGAVGNISICGSCLAVPVPLHNVAGAPMTTVSPREFVPV